MPGELDFPAMINPLLWVALAFVLTAPAALLGWSRLGLPPSSPASLRKLTILTAVAQLVVSLVTETIRIAPGLDRGLSSAIANVLATLFLVGAVPLSWFVAIRLPLAVDPDRDAYARMRSRMLVGFLASLAVGNTLGTGAAFLAASAFRSPTMSLAQFVGLQAASVFGQNLLSGFFLLSLLLLVGEAAKTQRHESARATGLGFRQQVSRGRSWLLALLFLVAMLLSFFNLSVLFGAAADRSVPYHLPPFMGRPAAGPEVAGGLGTQVLTAGSTFFSLALLLFLAFRGYGLSRAKAAYYFSLIIGLKIVQQCVALPDVGGSGPVLYALQTLSELAVCPLLILFAIHSPSVELPAAADTKVFWRRTVAHAALLAAAAGTVWVFVRFAGASILEEFLVIVREDDYLQLPPTVTSSLILTFFLLVATFMLMAAGWIVALGGLQSRRRAAIAEPTAPDRSTRVRQWLSGAISLRSAADREQTGLLLAGVLLTAVLHFGWLVLSAVKGMTAALATASVEVVGAAVFGSFVLAALLRRDIWNIPGKVVVLSLSSLASIVLTAVTVHLLEEWTARAFIPWLAVIFVVLTGLTRMVERVFELLSQRMFPPWGPTFPAGRGKRVDEIVADPRGDLAEALSALTPDDAISWLFLEAGPGGGRGEGSRYAIAPAAGGEEVDLQGEARRFLVDRLGLLEADEAVVLPSGWDAALRSAGDSQEVICPHGPFGVEAQPLRRAPVFFWRKAASVEDVRKGLEEARIGVAVVFQALPPDRLGIFLVGEDSAGIGLRSEYHRLLLVKLNRIGALLEARPGWMKWLAGRADLPRDRPEKDRPATAG